MPAVKQHCNIYSTMSKQKKIMPAVKQHFATFIQHCQNKKIGNLDKTEICHKKSFQASWLGFKYWYIQLIQRVFFFSKTHPLLSGNFLTKRSKIFAFCLCLFLFQISLICGTHPDLSGVFLPTRSERLLHLQFCTNISLRTTTIPIYTPTRAGNVCTNISLEILPPPHFYLLQILPGNHTFIEDFIFKFLL